jgi:hypothetical protein
MTKLTLLTALIALLVASAATASTPAQYRTKVNSICRTYTPTFKKYEAAMTQAQKANDQQAYGIALGKLLVLTLVEDARIEKEPIPTALRTQMTPIVTRFKKIDLHVRAALAAAQANDPTGMTTQLKAATTIGAGFNAKLDAAGLRDCGSNQQ